MEVIRFLEKFMFSICTSFVIFSDTLASLDDTFSGSNITVDDSSALLTQARQIVREIQDREFTNNKMMADEELK